MKHYIKNILVFMPLLFLGNEITAFKLMNTFFGFIAFSLICSSIYIINDILDVEKDRLHPTKCKRPMASGAIPLKFGFGIATLCFLISVLINILQIIYYKTSFFSLLWLLTYFFINIGYSLKLKNIPIIDIFILMSGFLIRVVFGALLASTYVGTWMYLTVMSGAFYFAIGKRRNEINKTGGETRGVLAFYSYGFLDKFMYVSLAMTNVFYALWAKEYPKTYMILTVPIVVIICMQYSLDVEGDSDGDPVEVVLKDKKLILFSLFYIVFMIGILFAL